MTFPSLKWFNLLYAHEQAYGYLRARLVGPINRLVNTLVHTKPLPAWTNLALTFFLLALIDFTIGLKWWADSRAYVEWGLGIFGTWSLAIFWKVERDYTKSDKY